MFFSFKFFNKNMSQNRHLLKNKQAIDPWTDHVIGLINVFEN